MALVKRSGSRCRVGKRRAWSRAQAQFLGPCLFPAEARPRGARSASAADGTHVRLPFWSVPCQRLAQGRRGRPACARATSRGGGAARVPRGERRGTRALHAPRSGRGQAPTPSPSRTLPPRLRQVFLGWANSASCLWTPWVKPNVSETHCAKFNVS